MLQYLVLLSSLLPAVLGHGYVTGIVANGKWFMGYTPNIEHMHPKPKLPAWYGGGYGQGAIQKYDTPDIACHENSRPGESYAKVKAGSKVQIQWTPWAESHHGPVIDYLAPCPNNDCFTATASSLRFTKIQELGLVDPGTQGHFTFASDKLAKHNNTWEVEIPKQLKGGNYVLRTEIIALHVAGQPGGAQNYPQCFNIDVISDGTVKLPIGAPATSFYKQDVPGIVFNLYTKLESYPIPGPPLWKGAS